MYSQITVRGQSIYLYHHKLYVARTEMRKDAIWRQRMQQNPLAAGAPPRTQLGELTAPQTPSWWGGEGWMPVVKVRGLSPLLRFEPLQ